MGVRPEEAVTPEEVASNVCMRPGAEVTISCLMDRRKNSDVRNEQGLDRAEADGHGQGGEVWGETRRDQAGVAAVPEIGKVNGEKKLDLGASSGWSPNTCSGGGFAGRQKG